MPGEVHFYVPYAPSGRCPASPQTTPKTPPHTGRLPLTPEVRPESMEDTEKTAEQMNSGLLSNVKGLITLEIINAGLTECGF